MRAAWFQYVQKIRKRESRKLKMKSGTQITHRKAMSIASTTWGKEKMKIQRKVTREKRKESKNVVKVPQADTSEVLQQSKSD